MKIVVIIFVSLFAFNVFAAKAKEGCNSIGCEKGFACNFSIACPPPIKGAAGTCGEAGDNKCHKICSKNEDCKKKETCQEVDIFNGGDAAETVKICIEGIPQ